MPNQTFDAIVIGAGQSGPSLATRLASKGQKVAMIERHLFGGTCVNTGCIPTKTLVASARAAYVARRAADWGVMIDGNISVDMKKVKTRKDKVSEKSRTGVENWLKGTSNCTVFQGHARFTSDRTVQVGDDLLTADRIFINVGGRAAVPPLPGLDKVPYMTNSTILDLDVLPRHLIVVGGSYIGLEFAQMYRRFGSEVTVVERAGNLISHEDKDVCTAIEEILTKEQIDIRLNSNCIGASAAGDEIEVHADCDVGGRTVRGSHLLVALGREPNTHDLGLENTGIVRDKRGYIEVDDQLQTSVPGIYAIGDCNGKGAFTHTSYNDYEIVAANLIDGESRRVTDRIKTYGLFVDPPLGRAGMTENEVRRAGKRALIGKRPMTKVGRAVEKGETDGFIKVLVDADNKQILGAAILGTEGDEAVHCILDVMYAKAPYTVLQQAVHIHPTVSELIPTVLGDLKPLWGG